MKEYREMTGASLIIPPRAPRTTETCRLKPKYDIAFDRPIIIWFDVTDDSSTKHSLKGTISLGATTTTISSDIATATATLEITDKRDVTVSITDLQTIGSGSITTANSITVKYYVIALVPSITHSFGKNKELVETYDKDYIDSRIKRYKRDIVLSGANQDIKFYFSDLEIESTPKTEPFNLDFSIIDIKVIRYGSTDTPPPWDNPTGVPQGIYICPLSSGNNVSMTNGLNPTIRVAGDSDFFNNIMVSIINPWGNSSIWATIQITYITGLAQ